MCFFEKLATVLPKLRTKIQLTGIVLIIAGYIAVRAIAPDQIPAQLSAGGIGVLFLIFGQTFQILHLIPKPHRAAFILSMFFGFLVFLFALILATISFLSPSPQLNRSTQLSPSPYPAADEAEERADQQLSAITAGRADITSCSVDSGSKVQLFEGGWLLAHYSQNTLYAINKEPGEEITWLKTKDVYDGKRKDTDAAEAKVCDPIEDSNFLEWGFRYWYCGKSPQSQRIRTTLRKPLTKEIPVWVQYKNYLMDRQHNGGLLAYGLPGSTDGLNKEGHFERFVRLDAVFLENEMNADDGRGKMVSFTHSGANQDVYCTSLWYPAAQRGNTILLEKPALLKKRSDCPDKVSPKKYKEGRKCSIYGFK